MIESITIVVDDSRHDKEVEVFGHEHIATSDVPDKGTTIIQTLENEDSEYGETDVPTRKRTST